MITKEEIAPVPASDAELNEQAGVPADPMGTIDLATPHGKLFETHEVSPGELNQGTTESSSGLGKIAFEDTTNISDTVNDDRRVHDDPAGITDLGIPGFDGPFNQDTSSIYEVDKVIGAQHLNASLTTDHTSLRPNAASVGPRDASSVPPNIHAPWTATSMEQRSADEAHLVTSDSPPDTTHSTSLDSPGESGYEAGLEDPSLQAETTFGLATQATGSNENCVDDPESDLDSAGPPTDTPNVLLATDLAHQPAIADEPVSDPFSTNEADETFSDNQPALPADFSGNVAIDPSIFDDLIISAPVGEGGSIDYWPFEETQEVGSQDELVFSIELTKFREMLAIAECTLDLGPDRAAYVRVQLSERDLTMRSFGSCGATEATAILLKKAHIPSDWQAGSWVFAFSELLQTAEAAGTVLVFRLKKDLQRIIHVESEGFNRPLVLESDRMFIDHSAVDFTKLPPPKQVPIRREALLHALNYVAPHAIDDQVSPHTAVVEIRRGHVIAGGGNAVVMVTNPAFKGVELKIRVRSLSMLQGVLAMDTIDEFNLYEVNGYYAFSLSNIAVAFEKTDKSLSDTVDGLFEQSRTETFLLGKRSGVASSLAALGFRDDRQEATVRLDVRGAWKKARVTFHWKDQDGRRIRFHTSCNRQHAERFSAEVSLIGLLRALTTAQSDLIDLHVLAEGKAILVEDESGERRTQVLLPVRQKQSLRSINVT